MAMTPGSTPGLPAPFGQADRTGIIMSTPRVLLVEDATFHRVALSPPTTSKPPSKPKDAKPT